MNPLIVSLDREAAWRFTVAPAHEAGRHLRADLLASWLVMLRKPSAVVAVVDDLPMALAHIRGVLEQAREAGQNPPPVAVVRIVLSPELLSAEAAR